MFNKESPMHLRTFIALLFSVATSPLLAQRGWTTITNGNLWLTPNGDTVQAHAPGFLYEGGRWWMVGEDRAGGRLPDVNLYSSIDLQHWQFEHKIITLPPPASQGGPLRMIERAKLLRCPTTGEYVVWCHWEAPNYSASESACFHAPAIRGPYTCAFSGRPLGIKARDCNVFVDHDGSAYFIATTNENRDLGLFRLSDDYLSVVSHVPLLQGERREAPAIVHVGDTYYMLSSACTGWAPNQCKLTTSHSLTEGWTPLRDVGDKSCYRTQAAAILTIKGTRRTTYLYVGDRWKDPTLAESKTIIFPLTLSGDTCHIHPLDSFQINLRTGRWREKK